MENKLTAEGLKVVSIVKLIDDMASKLKEIAYNSKLGKVILEDLQCKMLKSAQALMMVNDKSGLKFLDDDYPKFYDELDAICKNNKFTKETAYSFINYIKGVSEKLKTKYSLEEEKVFIL